MRKPASKKTRQSRRTKSKSNRYVIAAWIFFFTLVLASTAYHYRNGLAYYFGFKTHKTTKQLAKERRLADIRNAQVLAKYNSKVAGFDVSEYQGDINWADADSVEGDYRLEFVFIRATAGNNYVDKRFKKNWREATKQDLICGAYHYYRPNENSIEQAENFIRTVKLRPGDFPPVLDIEQLPKKQSIARLKIGLRRWLERVEKHYKVKPIIYSGEKYYDDFLKDEFEGYTFWIANYNFFVDSLEDDWSFWQFTEKGVIKGINGNVDINIYNGDYEQLNELTISPR